jgi:hypothetical protein
MEPRVTLPRLPIPFPAGQVALAVRAGPATDLPAAIRGMGLTTGVPTIVVVGAGTRPAQVSRLGPLLEKVVVRVADAVDATVVDDGAAGGVAALLGQIRLRRKAGFALLGVAPDDGRHVDGAGLDPEHTHFVLVPAGAPDARAAWVAAVAGAVAGGNGSVALVTGGGEPAWDDVVEHVRAGRAVLAVARTGGVADHLAAALAGRPADARAAMLARTGNVRAADPGRGAAHVAEELRTMLRTAGRSSPAELGPAPGRPGP